MDSLKEADMIVAKMDVLAKRLEQYEKMSTQEAVQSLDSHMTCEVYGESRHSDNHCPETHEDLNFLNNDNGFHQPNQGWNQHSNSQGNTFNTFPRSNFPNNNNNNGYLSLKDLVYSQGRLTDNLNKKLLANDKILENKNAKLDDFSSAMKNQLSFNKMLETQLAQFASAIPSFESGKIPSKPKNMETANLVDIKYFNFGDQDLSIKKSDPGSPIIECTIGSLTFKNVVCDLGSSVNIMSKEVYETYFVPLAIPTGTYLQLIDNSTHYTEGIATDLLVQIRGSYVPTDFMILDMGNSKDVPLILGRPFHNIVNACIYVGSGKIQMTLAGKRETKFPLPLALHMQLTCRQGNPMKKKQEIQGNQVSTGKGPNPRTQDQREEDGIRRRNPHQLPRV